MMTLGYPNMISMHGFEELVYTSIGLKNNKRGTVNFD
jgi:hypothetical protein